MMNPSIDILQHPSGSTVVYRYFPSSQPNREEGVLLVPSAPWDTMRLSWFYKQCCEQLVKLGYHVYRFDLKGTGDSPYPTSDIDARVWLTETEAVREALRSQVRRLHAIGPRFGGLLAYLSSETYAYRSLHLIDPILNPAAYRQELELIQSRFLSEQNRFGADLRTTGEILGFPTATFDALATHDLGQMRSKTKRLFLSMSQGWEVPQTLTELWQTQEREVSVTRVTDTFAWTDPAALVHQCFCNETLKNVIQQLMEV